MKYTCVVCGYRTLNEPHDWNICRVCRWEDDVIVGDHADISSPANHMSVAQAQANFIKFGAKNERSVDNARPPRPDEEKDPNWQLLPRAEELLAEMKD
jgi:Cysteine-rich CPCC